MKFVASVDEMERFVDIMARNVTSLPSPGTTNEEIQAQIMDLEVKGGEFWMSTIRFAVKESSTYAG